MGFEVTPIYGLIENAYLLTGDRVALIDTMGPASYRKLLKALEGKGVRPEDVEFILITHNHFDHCGNLARIKAVSGAQVMAGEADVPIIEGSERTARPSDLNRLGRLMRKLPRALLEGYQRFKPTSVDRTLKGGEAIEELGLEVLALPGHTAGGIGFLDREGGRAFAGDLVSNWFGRMGMPTISASESIEKILESQKLLAGLGLDTVYPGHGRVITPDASQKISEYVAKQRARRR